MAMFMLLIMLASLGFNAAQAAATKVVITDPSRRTLQVLSAGTSSGKVVGTLRLSSSLGDIYGTAVAGSYAFTAASGRSPGSIAVTRISGSRPKVIKTLRLSGLTSGFFSGCVLTGEDIAAKKTGSGYDIYAVIGCRRASGQRPAANYAAIYRFDPASSKISGPSTERRYFLNKFDKNMFVSIVNSMSVFGGGASGSGTVYVVLTTTSTSNGKVYKPALHVLKDNKAVPLGILATSPSELGPTEAPRFAIAGPTSFYAVYKQKCRFSAGSAQCNKAPSAKEVVTLTRQYSGTTKISRAETTDTSSPTALAFSPQNKALYRIRGGSKGAALLARPNGSAGFRQVTRLSSKFARSKLSVAVL